MSEAGVEGFEKKVYCFQFISQAQIYLLPSITILEILPFNEIEQTDEQPPWLLGLFPWREIKVPIVNLSLEASSPIVKTKLTRMILFHSLTSTYNAKFPSLGTVIDQIPKSLTINEGELTYQLPLNQQAVAHWVVSKDIKAKMVDLEKLSNEIAHHAHLWI